MEKQQSLTPIAVLLGALALPLACSRFTNVPGAPNGLSSDDAEAIEQFAAEVRAGMGVVTPAEQHRIFKLLRLWGTVVQDDEHGIQLKRRRFSTGRHADLPLRHETTRFSILPGT